MNRLPSVKSGKAFRMWDLLFYGIILLLISALVLAAVLIRKDDGAATGIRITQGGETVYIYRFGEGGETVPKEGVSVETQQEGTKLFVTVRVGDAYNRIEIDAEGRTARVVGANCSARRDCTKMAPVKENGTILCVPHALCVEPLREDLFRPTL